MVGFLAMGNMVLGPAPMQAVISGCPRFGFHHNLAMHVNDLDYAHPAELVAQSPCEPRDAARLLLVGEEAGQRHHVRDLRQLLQPGDLLVLNTTKVIPARLLGNKESGGKIEVLLIHPIEGNSPEQGNAGTTRDPRQGTQLHLHAGTNSLEAHVEALAGDAQRTVRFAPGVDVLAHAMEFGAIPLPPYIRREADDNDEERYQSMFSRKHRLVAAPTASLHFTPELLADLKAKGVQSAEVELRVGPGTFKPVEHEQVEDHPIHHEWCCCPQETIDAIQRTRAAGGRVIAVGTTVVRTLETAWESGKPLPYAGWTARFLYPPQIIHGCDMLMTNFHLPKSTLLAMVSCLIEREELLAHYAYAIAEGYRLFSYGDAMLIPNRRKNS